jgi:hypothetical protein
VSVRTQKKASYVPKTKPRNGARSKTKPRATGASRRSVPVDVRRINAAVRRFDHAQQAAAARGVDLLAVAAALGAAAVEKALMQIVSQLVERELLRDILALKDAFASAPPGSLPSELDRVRLVPDAVIQWLAESLHVSPSSETGDLEVPAGKLSRFICEFQPPTDANRLMRVRVISPGWSRNGKSVLRARVRLVEGGRRP